MKSYARLERLCVEPKDQHHWDDMMRVGGYADGLCLAVDYLEEFAQAAVKVCTGGADGK